MKNVMIILALWIPFLANTSWGEYIFVDGGYHLINTATYQSYMLDRTAAGQRIWNNPGTRLEVTTGGVVGSISTWCRSSVIISGGTTGEIQAFSYGTVEIFSGWVSRIWTDTQSIVHVRGGHIGAIDTGSFNPVYLYGSNFSVGGQALGHGARLSGYGFSGTITGTLQDGTILNSNFSIAPNADIVIIPEPASLLLLGLGGWVIRKWVI